MRLTHRSWTLESAPSAAEPADLVFAFGPTALMGDGEVFSAVRRAYPDAQIVGASTGGQIRDVDISDEFVATTAVSFESSAADVVHAALGPGEDGAQLGRRLGEEIAAVDAEGRPLVHVFVLADGLSLNGSAFAAGVEAGLPTQATVTGGLAGDDDRFERTLLWADAVLPEGSALAVALYGADLRVGVGAAGGWGTFGVDRKVTRAEGNVLAELDGRPALDLYEEYLGPYAADLPASGLRFPLSIRTEGSDYELVRSILGIDRDARTLTFAGDVPEGATARLMRANPENLVDGAHLAVQRATQSLGGAPEMALLVSCVGRRWMMGERIEEEVEETSATLGGAPSIGFYSYGELAPAPGGVRCELHNQTMTVTVLAERTP